MDAPFLTAETYRMMQSQQISDEEVFAALYSPIVQDTATPTTRIGIAHLPDKTVWAFYTKRSDGQPVILRCWARYLKIVSSDDLANSYTMFF